MISSTTAYVIVKDNDGYYLQNGIGEIVSAEDMIEVGKGLVSWTKKHYSEIQLHNEQITRQFQMEMYEWCHRPKPKKPKQKKYIYFFECGGRYKIGSSNDTDRRLMELDNRPFPLVLVAKSKLSEQGYDFEMFLHSKLEKYRICGEWYEFPKEIVEKIKALIDGKTVWNFSEVDL